MAGLLRAYACVVRDTVPVYPLSVHAGHSLFCIASFREWRQGKTEKEPSWLHNLVASFFCFGFGGSSTADFLISTTSVRAPPTRPPPLLLVL